MTPKSHPLRAIEGVLKVAFNLVILASFIDGSEARALQRPTIVRQEAADPNVHEDSPERR